MTERPLVRPKTRPPGLLVLGDLVQEPEDGSVWRVERVSLTGANVLCVYGQRRGRRTQWTSSSAGMKLVSADDVQALAAAAKEKVEAAATRAELKTEAACPNCWPAFTEDIVRDEGMGRDGACPDHQVPEED